MTPVPVSLPHLSRSPLRVLTQALSGVLTALVPKRSTQRGVPSVVAAGRSMRIVNDHHVDFPRFSGDMPF
jgi:hypothetical protein